MILVNVRDTAGNVFAFHDCDSIDETIALVSEWIIEGFRVEAIPKPEPFVIELVDGRTIEVA